jgi:2-polyprenyl-6-methoxyphenol hydroxylase-like FAD-dependent oxidoreductase
MNDSTDFYFDSVSQIVLDTWSKYRIVMLGDACQCVSLIAGQGTSLAMAGAYILGGELNSCSGNFKKAFSKYQSIMVPEILTKQNMGVKFAGSFVPDTEFGIWVRDKFTNFMVLPFISKWFIRRYLLDTLQLPEY